MDAKMRIGVVLSSASGAMALEANAWPTGVCFQDSVVEIWTV
jgi:hypothetical protein